MNKIILTFVAVVLSTHFFEALSAPVSFFGRFFSQQAVIAVSKNMPRYTFILAKMGCNVLWSMVKGIAVATVLANVLLPRGVKDGIVDWAYDMKGGIRRKIMQNFLFTPLPSSKYPEPPE